ncbi:multiple epidermal growth factor-like domains protein 11 isoform X1 [Ostrea edulis]|uniref:multiple epidermal growth factor-like domains protein 11 isoform X1 n=1 Tax=Ostrea edulis TaxID=37623 RepID=UPI0024AF0C05|nr:multiple epidermal growth factor-like domains protein 11 isoform X1 [Ostrea edulis]
MVVFLQIFILYAFYLKWTVCAKEGVCNKGDSNKTKECCSSYRKIKGECIECVGFFGDNCEKQCVDGYFGKSCKEACNCTKSETCNQYVGCIETKTQTTSEVHTLDSENAQTTTYNKEACPLVRLMVPAITTLPILSFIMCFMICLYRTRRQGKYKVDNAMKMKSIPQKKSQNIQLIHYISNAHEHRQYSDIDITKYTYNREFEKHVTHDYSRIIFPKFTSVDIPADQYSTVIIRNPHVLGDGESGSSTDTSDGGDMQERLRHPSTDRRSAQNSRPYSLVHPEWI